jgi:putative nucleotidyltransferase with HDIG domain
MHPLNTFIESKVARRIFGLFVVCAMGPMLVLALVSYVQVSRQLSTASRTRQHEAAKNVGMDVISRLRRLEGELTLAEATLGTSVEPGARLNADIASRLATRFDNLEVQRRDESVAVLLGGPVAVARLTSDELSHLTAGRTVLRIDDTGRFSMIRSLGQSGDRIVATLAPASLWNETELKPSGMELAVLAPSGAVLFSSRDDGFSVPKALAESLKTTTVGEAEWTSNGARHLGSYWTVPLAFDFLIPKLTIVVSEDRASVLAPMVSARLTFILVSLLSLWIVMLLSLVHVRRSLVPLNQLARGAQRIGEGNLDTSVQVSSGDEFEALADAFNSMTDRLRRQFQALDRLNVGTLNALARTVDAKSPWTAGHSQRVTTLAVAIGRELGLPDDRLDLITRGGLLHDIGKIAVPSAILDKATRLTDAEYAVMKEHPRTGARILEPIAEYERLLPIVLQHHEWMNGCGYPDGLAGDQISFEARVVAVSDVFDAVSSTRPYRAAMDLDQAVRVIQDGSGTQFDPRVVQAFLSVIARTHREPNAA